MKIEKSGVTLVLRLGVSWVWLRHIIKTSASLISIIIIEKDMITARILILKPS